MAKLQQSSDRFLDLTESHKNDWWNMTIIRKANGKKNDSN